MKQQKARAASGQDPNPSTILFFKPSGENSFRLGSPTSMTSTSDTDSCTAIEPVQILTPPPSPPLAGGDATATPTPPPTSAAKKKKKKKSKKSNKGKDATSSPASPLTPAPAPEENQPPPLFISRNKHWKYISSFHVRHTPCQ